MLLPVGQALKHVSLWESFLFRPPQGWKSSLHNYWHALLLTFEEALNENLNMISLFLEPTVYLAQDNHELWSLLSLAWTTIWVYAVFRIEHCTSCMLGNHSTNLDTSPSSVLSSVFMFVCFYMRLALSLSCLEFMSFLVLFNGFLWSWKFWGYLFLPVFFLPPPHLLKYCFCMFDIPWISTDMMFIFPFCSQLTLIILCWVF